jgi:hypothetical protein
VAAFKGVLEQSWVKAPYEPYELSNLGANIRTTKKRIEKLLAEATARQAGPTPDIEGAGFTITENLDENRVQILFPGKPSVEVRRAVKAAGCRWSPSQGAWQRQLNDNGRYAARSVATALNVMAGEPPPEPEPAPIAPPATPVVSSGGPTVGEAADLLARRSVMTMGELETTLDTLKDLADAGPLRADLDDLKGVLEAVRLNRLDKLPGTNIKPKDNLWGEVGETYGLKALGELQTYINDHKLWNISDIQIADALGADPEQAARLVGVLVERGLLEDKGKGMTGRQIWGITPEGVEASGVKAAPKFTPQVPPGPIEPSEPEKAPTKGRLAFATFQDGEVTAYWHPTSGGVVFADTETGFWLEPGKTYFAKDKTTLSAALELAIKKMGPEDPRPPTPQSRDALRAAGFVSGTKNLALKPFGYYIVKWFNPSTGDKVFEYRGGMDIRGGQKADKRKVYFASTREEQEAAHRAIGAPVTGFGRDTGEQGKLLDVEPTRPSTRGGVSSGGEGESIRGDAAPGEMAALRARAAANRPARVARVAREKQAFIDSNKKAAKEAKKKKKARSKIMMVTRDAEEEDQKDLFRSGFEVFTPDELLRKAAVAAEIVRLKAQLVEARKPKRQRVTEFYIRKGKLQKAEAKGGTYYKRMPAKSGSKKKWRYFYDAKDYDGRDDAHTGGEDNARAHLSKRVLGCVTDAGSKGCGPDGLGDLVKKFGAKGVAEALRDGKKSGTLAYKKGKFSMCKKDPA